MQGAAYPRPRDRLAPHRRHALALQPLRQPHALRRDALQPGPGVRPPGDVRRAAGRGARGARARPSSRCAADGATPTTPSSSWPGRTPRPRRERSARRRWRVSDEPGRSPRAKSPSRSRRRGRRRPGGLGAHLGDRPADAARTGSRPRAGPRGGHARRAPGRRRSRPGCGAVARFAPARRARLGAAPLATALDTDPSSWRGSPRWPGPGTPTWRPSSTPAVYPSRPTPSRSPPWPTCCGPRAGTSACRGRRAGPRGVGPVRSWRRAGSRTAA